MVPLVHCITLAKGTKIIFIHAERYVWGNNLQCTLISRQTVMPKNVNVYFYLWAFAIYPSTSLSITTALIASGHFTAVFVTSCSIVQMLKKKNKEAVELDWAQLSLEVYKWALGQLPLLLKPPGSIIYSLCILLTLDICNMSGCVCNLCGWPWFVMVLSIS